MGLNLKGTCLPKGWGEGFIEGGLETFGSGIGGIKLGGLKIGGK